LRRYGNVISNFVESCAGAPGLFSYTTNKSTRSVARNV